MAEWFDEMPDNKGEDYYDKLYESYLKKESTADEVVLESEPLFKILFKKKSFTVEEVISAILSDEFPYPSPLDYEDEETCRKKLRDLFERLNS
jgi:hypothetical protein